MKPEPFRIPNLVFFIISAVALIATWGVIVYAYPLLPARIPTHFGLAGAADAWSAKSFWTVSMPGIIQAGIIVLMIWVYRHPQYSNIPTTMALVLIPEETKRKVFWVIRHMIAVITTITTLLFAYLELTIVAQGLGSTAGLNSWIMIGLVGFLFLVIIVYTVWMYREIAAARRTPPHTTH